MKYFSYKNNVSPFLGISLPLSIFISNYLFAFTVVLLIIQSPRKKKIDWLPMLILAIPAFVPFLSIFFHQEEFSFTDADVKIPFLVIALIIGFVRVDYNLLSKFKYGFVLGTIVASILTHLEGIFINYRLLDVLYFDVSYTSFFIVISLIFLWYTDFEIKNSIKLVASFVLIVSLLASSQLFFITAGILICFSALIVKGSPILSRISIALFVILSSIIFYKGAEIQRFIAPYQNIEEVESNDKLAQWQCVLEIMKNNELLGVGFIQKEQLLLDCYREHSMTKAESLLLNAHNEYLDFFLILGYIGVLALVIYFINALFVAYDNKQVAHLLIIILISLFALTENVFTRQKGVMITSITYLLIYSAKGFSNTEKEHTETEDKAGIVTTI